MTENDQTLHYYQAQALGNNGPQGAILLFFNIIESFHLARLSVYVHKGRQTGCGSF